MSDLRLLGFSRPLPVSLLLHVFSPTTSHDEQPNQAMQPTAGRRIASLYFMKTPPLQVTLALDIRR